MKALQDVISETAKRKNREIDSDADPNIEFAVRSERSPFLKRILLPGMLLFPFCQKFQLFFV